MYRECILDLHFLRANRQQEDHRAEECHPSRGGSFSMILLCDVPFGKAAIRRGVGDNITIVAWGVRRLMAQKNRLKSFQKEMKKEVLDLRTLVPLIWMLFLLTERNRSTDRCSRRSFFAGFVCSFKALQLNNYWSAFVHWDKKIFP